MFYSTRFMRHTVKSTVDAYFEKLGGPDSYTDIQALITDCLNVWSWYVEWILRNLVSINRKVY